MTKLNNKIMTWSRIIYANKKKILISLFLLVLALSIYLMSGDYLNDHDNYAAAPDLILDHFGPYDLSLIYVWFFLAVIVIYFSYPLIFKPNELHYYISIFSLFIVIRSGFVIFTHLGVPLDAVTITFPGRAQLLNFTNDLFFSGHTGIPFLGFLVFKEKKILRYFMLCASIILGITVLLMHVHYSIDVFSAFFITYGVYKIGNKFIRK